jgi:hypothetical protein
MVPIFGITAHDIARIEHAVDIEPCIGRLSRSHKSVNVKLIDPGSIEPGLNRPFTVLSPQYPIGCVFELVVVESFGMVYVALSGVPS